MDFLFTGICKNCGREINFCLSPDTPEEFKYALHCPHCGVYASDNDSEKMYHLVDTLQNASERNGLSAIKMLFIKEGR